MKALKVFAACLGLLIGAMILSKLGDIERAIISATPEGQKPRPMYFIK